MLPATPNKAFPIPSSLVHSPAFHRIPLQLCDTRCNTTDKVCQHVYVLPSKPYPVYYTMRTILKLSEAIVYYKIAFQSFVGNTKS